MMMLELGMVSVVYIDFGEAPSNDRVMLRQNKPALNLFQCIPDVVGMYRQLNRIRGRRPRHHYPKQEKITVTLDMRCYYIPHLFYLLVGSVVSGC